jgi:hypothetical protein
MLRARSAGWSTASPVDAEAGLADEDEDAKGLSEGAEVEEVGGT